MPISGSRSSGSIQASSGWSSNLIPLGKSIIFNWYTWTLEGTSILEFISNYSIDYIKSRNHATGIVHTQWRSWEDSSESAQTPQALHPLRQTCSSLWYAVRFIFPCTVGQEYSTYAQCMHIPRSRWSARWGANVGPYQDLSWRAFGIGLTR